MSPQRRRRCRRRRRCPITIRRWRAKKMCTKATPNDQLLKRMIFCRRDLISILPYLHLINETLSLSLSLSHAHTRSLSHTHSISLSVFLTDILTLSDNKSLAGLQNIHSAAYFSLHGYLPTYLCIAEINL